MKGTDDARPGLANLPVEGWGFKVVLQVEKREACRPDFGKKLDSILLTAREGPALPSSTNSEDDRQADLPWQLMCPGSLLGQQEIRPKLQQVNVPAISGHVRQVLFEGGASETKTDT